MTDQQQTEKPSKEQWEAAAKKGGWRHSPAHGGWIHDDERNGGDGYASYIVQPTAEEACWFHELSAEVRPHV